MRKYTFRLTREEIRELCLRAIWELLLLGRFKYLLLLAILALEYVLLSWTGVLAIVLMLLVILTILTVRSYFAMKQKLCEKTRTMWIEDGMLKLDTEGELYSEVLGSNAVIVRKTSHLLMLGFRQKPKVIGWYPIPLRVFTDNQERDGFVESVRNPKSQAKEDSAIPEAGEDGKKFAGDFGEQAMGEPVASSAGSCVSSATEESGQEYLSLTFQVGEEEWVRMMTDATEVIRAGTLGEQKKDKHFRTALAATSFFLILLSFWLAWVFSNDKVFIRIMLLVGAIIPLSLLRSLSENPEENIRRQIRREKNRENLLGIWETAVTERGIWQGLSGKKSAMIPWENMFGMVETDAELLFYKKDRKSFIPIPKRCMESREQIEGLKELCRERQLEILAGKRKKYIPKGFFTALMVSVLMGYAAINVWSIFRDSGREATPDYVPFDEQVSVLRSFGFTVPEEMAEVLRGYMEENEITAYVEEYPYIWLLGNLAWADDDQEWMDWFQEGAEVFWFDFEGWDISTDYIMVLEGMRELSPGSILDDVRNIREDTEDMDWEEGTGTITVSLEWKGQEYSWKMDVEYDWIDPEVLGIYNGLLEKEDVPRRFYVTGDDGQGAYVFYCTDEWATAFGYATGLDLEAYMVEAGW